MRINRRNMLKATGATAVGVLAASAASAAPELYQPKGNIRQSVCKWCYNGKKPLDKIDRLTEEAAKVGYKSIELLLPEEVAKVKPFGLGCAVIGVPNIPRGLNREEFHPRILDELRKWIDAAADLGVPNVICMAGNRTLNGRTVSEEEGIATCAKGLKQVVGLAEQKKVTIIMEGLNSKKDHRDYMYDKTSWGVELCKAVGSDRFKLLYDIYHMQIMEGDVIATVRKYKDYIAHYHTGGVPGRAEIDETQELNYPAIVRAILANGYQGYLGQEYIPKHEPVASLAQGFRICDV